MDNRGLSPTFNYRPRPIEFATAHGAYTQADTARITNRVNTNSLTAIHGMSQFIQERMRITAGTAIISVTTTAPGAVLTGFDWEGEIGTMQPGTVDWTTGLGPQTIGAGEDGRAVTLNGEARSASVIRYRFTPPEDAPAQTYRFCQFTLGSGVAF